MAALGDWIIRYAQEDQQQAWSYVTRLADIDRRISGTNDKVNGSRGWEKTVCKTVAMVWQEPDTPGILDMDRVMKRCKLFQRMKLPVQCLPISIFSPQEIATKTEYVARLYIIDNHGQLPEPIGILNLMWILKGWTIERCTIVWLCIATTGWTTVKLEGPAGTSTWGLETDARGTPLIGITFTWLSWRCLQHSVIVKFSTFNIRCSKTTDS
jgi:hypothetical protein